MHTISLTVWIYISFLQFTYTGETPTNRLLQPMPLLQPGQNVTRKPNLVAILRNSSRLKRKYM
jgi:hypothetical protein